LRNLVPSAVKENPRTKPSHAGKEKCQAIVKGL
jgi:hypothetical protein